LLLLYTITTFYKVKVLVTKYFLDVEKERIAPLFLFKLYTFVGGSAKILFAPGAGHPCYATDWG